MIGREPGLLMAMPRAQSGHSSLVQVGKSTDNRLLKGISPKGFGPPVRLTMEPMPTTRAPDPSRIEATSRVLFPVVTTSSTMTMSKPADRCEYEVLFDGGPADEGVAQFAEEPPGAWLTVAWIPCTADDCVVLKIRLHCFDVRGVERGVELFPWWLEIPHEEVVFATGSASLHSSEAPKLDRAYDEIAKAVLVHIDKERFHRIPWSGGEGG